MSKKKKELHQVTLSINAASLISNWLSWFAVPGRATEKGDLKPLVNDLIRHFSSDHHRLDSENFLWEPNHSSVFTGKNLGFKQSIYDMLEKWTKALMPPDTLPQNFLDRLIELYDRDSNIRELRKVISSYFINKYYKISSDEIALDFPLGLLPPKMHGPLSPLELTRATKFMAKLLADKTSPQVKEYLDELRATLVPNPVKGAEFQFIVLKVKPAFKSILLSASKGDDNFTSNVRALLLKALEAS